MARRYAGNGVLDYHYRYAGGEMQRLEPETRHDPLTITAEAEARPWWAVTAYWTPQNWVVRAYHTDRACPSIELYKMKSRKRAVRLAEETAGKLDAGVVPW